MHRFISDLHVVDDVAVQDDVVSNWNSFVSPEDTVVINGDFASLSGKQVNQLLARLNGKKKLVIGNDDKYISDSDFNPSLFEEIAEEMVIQIEKIKVYLKHMPKFDWPIHKEENCIHLFAHVHEAASYILREEGMDNAYSTDYGILKHPASLEEVMYMSDSIRSA